MTVVPRVVVFAPAPILTVSIERDTTGTEEVHVHAGGQGVWVARLLRSLGCEPVVCGPFGGETGAVARSILERDGVVLAAVEVAGANAATVDEGVQEERRVIAETQPDALDRHELDDLYGVTLGAVAGAGAIVITGSIWGHVIPAETFGRLASDVASLGVPAIADLSGDQLRAALEHSVAVLKVSDEELERDGFLTGPAEADVLAAITALRGSGARDVVISRAGEPVLAAMGSRCYRVTGPALEVVEARGSGDSMTAALAAGTASGLAAEATLRLAVAAGAVNVTRHGLAGAEGDVVRRLADTAVTVEDLGPTDRSTREIR
ncbi:MAG TPA: PfkB family carbohydrate kinase [Acidimicrobiales bacterium]